MSYRCRIRPFRVLILLLIIVILSFWLIPSIRFHSKERHVDLTDVDEDFLDNHLYPPPWYLFNWTINDYFIRKDRLKIIEDQYAMDKKQKILMEDNSHNVKKSTYTILEYTLVLQNRNFVEKTRDLIFGEQCPYQNCRYTCDQSFSESADVLLMHRSDIDFQNLPKERNPEQIWLFWHDEPDGVPEQAIPFHFNWTISYRFNAEASIAAYGLTKLRDEELTSTAFDSYIDEQFDHRQSSALWFVSNCQPQARLNYYKELVSYYPSITVYGGCVQENVAKACHRKSPCEASELTNKKFYLAFESQSCRDYNTEKFWRSLVYGTIPIVFGPRTKQSLERLAPPNSFIYTGDFQSVSDLAKHLIEIGQNRTLFSKYHRWRRFYEVLYRSKDLEHYRFCELCYRLNTNHQKIFYQDLNQFFLEDC